MSCPPASSSHLTSQAEGKLPASKERVEKARAALAQEEKKPSTRQCTLFQPLPPELLQPVAPVPAAAAPAQASGKGKSKTKRQRSSGAAASASAEPVPLPPSPLVDLLGCQSLAVHLLAFLPSRHALRLARLCTESRPLVDAAITQAAFSHARPPPSDPIAFAARFPLLSSLTIDASGESIQDTERLVEFVRRLALETQLPARISCLTVIGSRKNPQGPRSVLNELLAVDWPCLAHVETNYVALFLTLTQQQAPALLQRLRMLGYLDFETRGGYVDNSPRTSRENIHALADALSAGAFSSPPALSRLAFDSDRADTWPGSLRALGDILAAVPGVSELKLNFGAHRNKQLAPVVQAMQPNQGAFQHLRCVDFAHRLDTFSCACDSIS